MTWSSIIAEGRGEVSYRLKIERLPTEFVTHVSMETATRKPWLRIGGKLKCESNPVSGDVNVSGLQATVIDKDGGATAIFAAQPTNVAWLMAELSSTETTSMTVRSTAGWPSSGHLWIDSEVIAYASTTATTFDTLTRGAYGSLAQAHYVEALGAARYPEATSSITSIAGCRARLYAYGQNDDPTGDGTQIWLGVVTRHPTLQGPTWSMSIDPITSVLSKTLSADLQESSGPRGISYNWSCRFAQSFTRLDTDESISINFPIETTDTAFFENNNEFCSYLTSKLETAITAAGWDVAFACSIRAIPNGDDGWHFGITSDATVPVHAGGSSGIIDPVFRGPPTQIDGDVWLPVSGEEGYFIGQPYSLPGAGSVPRGWLGTRTAAAPPSPALAAAFPAGRLYVAGAAIGSSVDALSAKWVAFGDQPEFESTPTILSTNASSNSVVLDSDVVPSGAAAPYGAVAWTAATAPEFRFGRTYTTAGNVYTALAKIITLAPTLLNKGAVPDLRSGDLDGTSWNAIDSSSQPRVVRARRFASFSDVELLEMVKQELLLAGFMLGISSTGTLAIAPIRGISRTELADLAVDQVLDVPTWEPTAYGMVNQALIERGYQPLEDEYTSPKVIVRNVAEFGRNPRPRTARIAPKSVPTAGVESYGECVEIAQRIFSAFAGPYAIVSAKVPLTSYNAATVGAVVALTSSHIPDAETGTMGVSGLRCIVMGREIDLAKGEVTLRMYASTSLTAGYAPSGVISGASNVSGDTWDLPLLGDYLPTGSTAEDWFAAGDLVYARQWDTTSDTSIKGAVDSVTSNTVRVTFGSSAAALASDTWYLTAQLASAALSDEQIRFCFLADTDMTVTFASGDAPARRFA